MQVSETVLEIERHAQNMTR